MEQLNKMTVIAVKDKWDVLKAASLFEKVGIKIFRSEESKLKLIETGDNIENNFLMRDEDGGCRIQSHFISDGTSIEELEAKVNEILKLNPTLIEDQFFNGIMLRLSLMEHEINSIKDSIINRKNNLQ